MCAGGGGGGGRGRGGEIFAATKYQNDVRGNKESQLCDSHTENKRVKSIIDSITIDFTVKLSALDFTI